VPALEKLDGWADLERIGFIDHPDGQAMATRLLSRMYPQEARVSALPCRGFINQIGLILEPVARGLGFTVIPRHARQALAGQEKIRVVEQAAPVVDSPWLVHRAEWPQGMATACRRGLRTI
jgi:DNA-binding transcriptional LysR family regulator